MSAPTQEYPPWLTPIPTVLTGVNGLPLTTITEILYLPLTYYGPSIPLGSYWTYGGLTSPAPSTSTKTAPTTTATSTATGPFHTTTTTAISPTAKPTSSVSSPTATPLSSSVSLFPSSTSTSASYHHALNHNQLVSVIVGSILGFLFVFIFIILLFLCCKGRRRDPSLDLASASPLDDCYHIISYADLADGEGSPRHSGGETDTFLRRRSQLPPLPPDLEMGGRPRHAHAIPRVPVPGANNTESSRDSGNSNGSSNNSGYGTVIPSTLNLHPTTRLELEHHRRGAILTPDELDRLMEEQFSEKMPEGLPPPRLVPPSRSGPSLKHHASQYSFNPYDEDEHPTVMTAQRVRVDQVARRSLPWLSLGRQRSGGGGFIDTIRRLSWFKPSDSASGKNGRPRSGPNTSDIEAGTSLLDTGVGEKRMLARGLGLDADRPVSMISAQSGNTAFFDAFSSLPSSPIPAIGTPPTPLPRALTPAGAEPGVPISSAPAALPTGPPPEYSINEDSHDIPNLNHGLPIGYDILDLPAPAPVTQFTSAPSIPSLLTRSVTSRSGSASIATYPHPPGLAFVPSKIWTDGSSGNALAGLTLERNNSVTIDMLEEEPPSPGESWRHLAVVPTAGKRSTFGQWLPPGQIPNIPSEDSFIESRRSPFGHWNRSTGSAPTSGRNTSYGSNASASSPRTAAASLVHSSSISSNARRWGRAASPAFSAFGGRTGRSSPPLGSMLAPPTPAHFENERTLWVSHGDGSGNGSVGASIGSAEPEPRSPVLSPSLLGAPWVTGLDSNWTAA